MKPEARLNWDECPEIPEIHLGISNQMKIIAISSKAASRWFAAVSQYFLRAE